MMNSAALQVLTEEIQRASPRMYRLDARIAPVIRVMEDTFRGVEPPADLPDNELIYRGIASIPGMPMRTKGFGNLLRSDDIRLTEDRSMLYQAMQREQTQRGTDDAPWDRVLRYHGIEQRVFTLLSDDLHSGGPSIHQTVAHNILTQWLVNESRFGDIVTATADGLDCVIDMPVKYQQTIGDAQDATLYHILSSLEQVATTYELTGPFAWHTPLIAKAFVERFQNLRAFRAIQRDVILTRKSLLSTLHREHFMSLDPML